jgi:hypothetical protein
MNHETGEKHMDHNHEELKKDWVAQTPIFEEIKRLGATEYFSGIANLATAFDADEMNVHCMDERTPGGVHCAGSGILLGLEKAAEFCKKSDAKGITSHEGCGAAGIYAKLNNLTGDSDELGIKFAKELAEKTGLPYTGHLPVEKKHHFARAAYYDGTGIFDWSKLPKDLPPGFFVNRANLEAEYAAMTEAATAGKIAMGDHGFGDLITKENPFYFFAIGNGELSMEKLQAELEPLKKEFGDKIVITGFNAPQR